MPSFSLHKTSPGLFGQHCAQEEIGRFARPGTRPRRVPKVHQGKVRTALCHVGALLQVPDPAGEHRAMHMSLQCRYKHSKPPASSSAAFPAVTS